MKNIALLLACALALATAPALAAKKKPAPKKVPAPIIDMHLHAFALDEFGPTPPKICADNSSLTWEGWDPASPLDFERLASCKNWITAPATDAEVMRQSLAALKRYNMYAVTSGELAEVDKWREAAPDRIIPSLNFYDAPGAARPEWLKELWRLYAEKKVAVFGEVTAQYRGFAPTDPTLEPFWAMAEELDAPVGIHMGVGPPGAPHWAYPHYRASLGNPLLLEEVLVKHPKLRLYVMHAGWPLTDEMIALLFSHPQVYVDISCDNWSQPPAEFQRELRRLVEAGFGKRILFGSDQMVWPQVIPMAIQSIASAKFLSPQQKRDILYNNAARFLRLSKDEIARHHGR